MTRPTMEQWDRMGRWSSSAKTWCGKAALTITGFLAPDVALTVEQRWVVGYEAERLLGALLDDCETLVPALQGDQLDEAERAVKQLALSIRRHRLGGLLENTTGRTPSETVAFREKAATLRGDRG